MHPSYEQPLADYVRFFAEQIPERNAYVDGDNSCTYARLEQRTNQVANALIVMGCKPGDRVAYAGINTGEYIETFFGAMKAKLICVGVNWRLAPPELEYILNDSGVKLVFCDEEFVPVYEKLQASVPSLETIVPVKRDAFSAWREAASNADPQLTHNIDDPVVQFYTSGTTGKPKGVTLDNKAMGEHRKAEDQYGDWYMSSNNHEIIINAMPNFHVGGLGWILMGMFRGAEVIQLAAPDPEQFLDLIEQKNATHLFAVPIILSMMLESQKKSPRDLSSLAVYHYGASSIAPSVLKEAIEVMGCGFTGYYGMTENNGVVTNLAPDQHNLDKPERLKSCGKPMAGIALKIIDTDGKEVSAGVDGEILVKSPGMMMSYWNKPEATVQALVDGWYHSGDGGHVDDEGYLYIAERIKDMIVSGGENIYPTEIENVLISHPAVAEVAVIGVPDEKWGECVKAFIVLVQDQSASEDEFIEFLRDKLAGYKIPRQYQFIDAIPRTPTGKIQKFKLS